MKLFINEKGVSISEVKGASGSQGECVSVYVNNFASCHSLPAHWFNSQVRTPIKTSSNLYEWKQEE